MVIKHLKKEFLQQSIAREPRRRVQEAALTLAMEREKRVQQEP